MALIITVVHILVSLALIFVVLLQKGSGADMGAAFGGSSQSVFGSRGSGSFLGKITAILATVFMLTSLTLAFFTTQKGGEVSVMGVPAAGTKKPVADADTQQTPVPPKTQQDSQKDPGAVAPARPAEVGAKPVPTMEKSDQAPVPPKGGTPVEDKASGKEDAVPPVDGVTKPATAPVENKTDGSPVTPAQEKTDGADPAATPPGGDMAETSQGDSKTDPVAVKPESAPPRE